MPEMCETLAQMRFSDPDAFRRALERRRPGALPLPGEKMMFVAADHPARGALAAGGDDQAMSNREDLLRRCRIALSRPGVRGFVGAPDMVEDLTLLGALEGKYVLGSMNRCGISGTVFEADDRLTAYTPAGIEQARLEGGKMLVRIAAEESATAGVLAQTAATVGALASAGRTSLVEPFLVHRKDGRLVNQLTADAMVRAVSIASALGASSARTWLKVPLVDGFERVAAASSLPMLVLGGEVPKDMRKAREKFRAVQELPTVKGFVIGRAVLYPHDGDVAAAVDRFVEVL